MKHDIQGVRRTGFEAYRVAIVRTATHLRVRGGHDDTLRISRQPDSLIGPSTTHHRLRTLRTQFGHELSLLNSGGTSTVESTKSPAQSILARRYLGVGLCEE